MYPFLEERVFFPRPNSINLKVAKFLIISDVNYAIFGKELLH